MYFKAHCLIIKGFTALCNFSLSANELKRAGVVLGHIKLVYVNDYYYLQPKIKTILLFLQQQHKKKFRNCICAAHKGTYHPSAKAGKVARK